MSYFDEKEPPKREDRLGACIAHHGTICGLAQRKNCKCMNDGDRLFTQGSICQLLPALAIMDSFADSAILLHGAIGCGSCAHAQNAVTKAGNAARGRPAKDTLWLSTALDETDVISGGEAKLEAAIREIDSRYRPGDIFVIVTCAPALTGDDVDGVIRNTQPQTAARLHAVYCQGFKTKIWATAYDSVYHPLGRDLLGLDPEEYEPVFARDDITDMKDEYERKHTVNVMTVSSMGRVDELELQRILSSFDLTANFFPLFAKPEEMYRVTRAAVSISTCPTHDDYLLSHLKEKYGIPCIISTMPIGIENTSQWIRDLAVFFGTGDQAERFIEQETAELKSALAQFEPVFAGKRAFVSAGEIRSFVTAGLLTELGFEIAGIRSFHHDEFADVEYRKLAAKTEKDYVVNIANAQPFEEANLLRKLKPDIFLGHWNGNSSAAKLGIPASVIYNTGLNFVGYKGVFEIARRLYKQLTNTAYNRKLAAHVRLPYREGWYGEDAFKYLKQAGGEASA
jgi:nitrogenase molybdenum-iron protein alpha chain